MKVQLVYRTITVPDVIIVDGKGYPCIHPNIDIIAEYDKTGDESLLDKLVSRAPQPSVVTA
jgi:hypothetical protein